MWIEIKALPYKIFFIKDLVDRKDIGIKYCPMEKMVAYRGCYCRRRSEYVAKRFRLDIKLANSFLCIRVSFSTEQYWGELKMLLKYLKGTKTEYLTLGMNGIELMKIWIDSSYAIHQYMKDPYWRIDINGERGCDYQILKTEY